MCRDTLFYDDFILSEFVGKFLSSSTIQEEGAFIPCYQCSDEGRYKYKTTDEGRCVCVGPLMGVGVCVGDH